MEAEVEKINFNSAWYLALYKRSYAPRPAYQILFCFLKKLVDILMPTYKPRI